MIDFDKEEFWARLDLRISTISALLSTHEKYFCVDLERRKFMDAQKKIDDANDELLKQMNEIDRKIQMTYEKLRKEFHEVPKDELQNAWCENLERLRNGFYGEMMSDPKVLLSYWKAQSEAGYPCAEENVRYFEDMVRKNERE